MRVDVTRFLFINGIVYILYTHSYMHMCTHIQYMCMYALTHKHVLYSGNFGGGISFTVNYLSMFVWRFKFEYAIGDLYYIIIYMYNYYYNIM